MKFHLKCQLQNFNLPRNDESMEISIYQNLSMEFQIIEFQFTMNVLIEIAICRISIYLISRGVITPKVSLGQTSS